MKETPGRALTLLSDERRWKNSPCESQFHDPLNYIDQADVDVVTVSDLVG